MIPEPFVPSDSACESFCASSVASVVNIAHKLLIFVTESHDPSQLGHFIRDSVHWILAHRHGNVLKAENWNEEEQSDSESGGCSQPAADPLGFSHLLGLQGSPSEKISSEQQLRRRETTC